MARSRVLFPASNQAVCWLTGGRSLSAARGLVFSEMYIDAHCTESPRSRYPDGWDGREAAAKLLCGVASNWI